MSSESTGSDGVKVPKKKRARRLKVVLRRLPHGMTDTDIYEQIEPIPASVSRRWFVPADLEQLPFAFSRAYFVFDDELEAMSFCQRFNGYVFVDKLGNESMALAEQAPLPDIPKKEGREHDRRMNTLESDSEYLKFLATYNSTVVKKITDFDGLLKEIEDKHRVENFVKPTPLTEFIESRQSTSRFDRRISQNAAARANRRAEKIGRQNATNAAQSQFPRGGGGGLPPDAKPKILARRPASGNAVTGPKEEPARAGPRERTGRGGGGGAHRDSNRGGRPRDGNRGGGPKEETRDEGRHARPAGDDTAPSAHPDSTAADTRNPRRRRERRRGPRNDKPAGEHPQARGGGGGSPNANTKGGDGRGGVAVMVLRRLKADVGGGGQTNNAKETSSRTTTG